MPKLKNTFWTKFDNNFYRLKNGILCQALNNIDSTVDTNSEINSISVSSDPKKALKIRALWVFMVSCIYIIS